MKEANDKMTQGDFARLFFKMLGFVGLGVLLLILISILIPDFFDEFYLVLLIFISIASAFALFGVLDSSATLQTNKYGFIIKLGGPVVLLVLIPLISYNLIKQKSFVFNFSVQVHGEKGITDFISINNGKVSLITGTTMIDQPINSSGTAFFEVSTRYLNSRVLFGLKDSQGFQLKDIGLKYQLRDGETIYLEVINNKWNYVQGTVIDNKGIPIDSVNVTVDGITCYSDMNGLFKIELPDSLQSKYKRVIFFKEKIGNCILNDFKTEITDGLFTLPCD